MSLQAALLEGTRVTVLGLAIVFAVLIILMIVMIAMKKVFYKAPEEQKSEPVVQAAAPTVPVVQNTQTMNDEELIAVLTAAVAASLKTSTYNLQIKSYRRIGQNTPAWRRAGINDTINSRL